jgi:HK97 family phage major capsid protein
MQRSGVRAAQRPEQRVVTTALPAGGPGGNMIQTTISGNIIDRLRERTVVRQLGATVLNDLVGNLSIPQLAVSTVGHWIAENAAISPSDPEVDQVAFDAEALRRDHRNFAEHGPAI